MNNNCKYFFFYKDKWVPVHRDHLPFNKQNIFFPNFFFCHESKHVLLVWWYYHLFLSLLSPFFKHLCFSHTVLVPQRRKGCSFRAKRRVIDLFQQQRSCTNSFMEQERRLLFLERCEMWCYLRRGDITKTRLPL